MDTTTFGKGGAKPAAGASLGGATPIRNPHSQPPFATLFTYNLSSLKYTLRNFSMYLSLKICVFK